MSCCRRMVTIGINTLHLNRGAARRTKPGVCYFFVSEGDKRGATDILAPDLDVVFEVTGKSKEGSLWDSVLLDAACTDSVNRLMFAPWETLSQKEGLEGVREGRENGTAQA